VSSAPGVTAQELTDLEAGDLCEVEIKRLYNLADGQAAIAAHIRSLWQNVANKKQVDLNNEYPFYGITLARS
jgi:hypothetical protein